MAKHLLALLKRDGSEDLTRLSLDELDARVREVLDHRAEVRRVAATVFGAAHSGTAREELAQYDRMAARLRAEIDRRLGDGGQKT